MTLEAKFIKEDIPKAPGLTGERSQKLWRLADGSHIVTSKVNDLYVHETYVFASDEHGNITDWGELAGSRRGEWSHEEAVEEHVRMGGSW